MTPAEKYSEEKDELKSARKTRILQAAFNLFAEKGIDTIAMTDIAKAAEIGVASLYRYYATKDEIAIRTTIWAWEIQKENIIPVLKTNEYEEMKGIEQLEKIFEMFIKLYEAQPDFLRYIYFFDSFAVRAGIDKKRLEDYERIIFSVQEIVINAIRKGLEDKSINQCYKDSENILYFSLMHTLFSTSQKLTLSGDLLNMDNQVYGKDQLNQISQILIKGLK